MSQSVGPRSRDSASELSQAGAFQAQRWPCRYRRMADSDEPYVITHDFEGDVCIKCGAEYEDALRGDIGCDAGPEGNDPRYLGSALTPEQQRTGGAPDQPYVLRVGSRNFTAKEFLAEIPGEVLAELPEAVLAEYRQQCRLDS